MTEPNPKFLADETVPRISYGGQEWPVPKMAARQQKHIFPAVSRLQPKLRPLMKSNLKEEIAAVSVDNPEVQAVMEDESIYELLLTVVFWGLKRAHPDLSRDEFEDMPTSLDELVQAMNVVVVQMSNRKVAKVEE